jgi:hypothetical protein
MGCQDVCFEQIARPTIEPAESVGQQSQLKHRNVENRSIVSFGRKQRVPSTTMTAGSCEGAFRALGTHFSVSAISERSLLESHF